MGYIYSFGFDKCGEYVLGERYREALFAKLESCPFTAEAKVRFYKDAALATNKALSGYVALLFTQPTTKFVPATDAGCDRPDMQRSENVLKEKLSEFDAAKITLADVVVDLASEPISCLKISKSGYEALGSDLNTGVSAHPAIPSGN
jgi:hypothetical protein